MATTAELKYTGPGAGEMMKTHTLASEIISRHPGPEHERIFDDAELARLRRFVAAPDSEGAAERKHCEETEVAEGETKYGGSLVRYLAGHHGTEKQGLTGEEIEKLKAWFENGGGQ